MNTWVVGNHPVAHYEYPYRGSEIKTNTIAPNRLVSTSSEIEAEEHGEKVFFMKGRIMAGQVDLSKNEYGDEDYQWLVKEEIEPVVGRKYWSSVKSMLTER